MSVLLFGVFILALIVGIPVAFSVMLAAIAVMVSGDVGLGMVAQRGNQLLSADCCAVLHFGWRFAGPGCNFQISSRVCRVLFGHD